MNTFYGVAEWSNDAELFRRFQESSQHKHLKGHHFLCCGTDSLGCFSQQFSKLKSHPIASDYHIVGNIAIYNRAELIDLLGLRSNEVAGCSDSLLVLFAFKKWSYDCAAKIVGDFVFSIWDRRKKELFSSVDHVGVRSFYYTFLKGGGVVFSDSIKGVANIEDSPSQISCSYIKDYLLDRIPDKEATVFEKVKRLPPGHSLLVNQKYSKQIKYWDLKSCSEMETSRKRNFAEELSGLLAEAVRCRIENKKHLGVLLSGGLDSSAVACITADILGKRSCDPKTLMAVSRVFTGKYKDKYRDEREYAEAIVKHTGMSAHYCHKEVDSPLEDLPEYYNAQFTFPVNPFFTITRPVSQAVSKMKVQTLLTGFGGDEGISMYGGFVYPLLLRKMRLLHFYKQLCDYKRVYNKSVYHVLRFNVLPFVVPPPILVLHRELRSIKLRKIYNVTFAGKDLLDNGGQQDWWEKYFKSGSIPSSAYDCIDGALFNNFFQQVFGLQRYFADQYGYVVCHPLLDKRLLEFCVGVPPEEFIEGGWNRSLFRRATKGVLLEKVRLRQGKSFFSKPYVGYIQSAHEFIQNVLTNKNSSAWDFIDRSELQMYNDLFGQYPKQVGAYEGLALRMAKAVNVAAFVQWHETRSL